MVISGGRGGQTRITFGENMTMVMEFSKMKMPEFAEVLSTYMDRPVVDMTELKGSYQVSLEIPREEMMNLARKYNPDLSLGAGGSNALVGAAPGTGGLGASDPSGGFFQAVQKLGLKLDPRKAPAETLVIDHLEKTPTED
jgi:uncharacterized protein (TIGR03435 family)